MPTYQVKLIDNQPTFSRDRKPVQLQEILDSLKHGGGLKVLSPAEYITLQQIRWFKGILLPALEKDTGNSVTWWETTLKTAVLPDDFPITVERIGELELIQIPSITTLSKKKMTMLIKGSVSHCRDECNLMWVTLPDEELRQ